MMRRPVQLDSKQDAWHRRCMIWFTNAWGGIKDVETCETPVGTPCIGCKVPIQPGDLGVMMPYDGNLDEPTQCAWHRGCLLDALGVAPEKLPDFEFGDD